MLDRSDWLVEFTWSHIPYVLFVVISKIQITALKLFKIMCFCGNERRFALHAGNNS